MKVLAFNCSPMMDKGHTALILGPFLEGLRAEGALVELFYTKKLKINPCQGELNCYFKTPGKCFQKDDMQMLYPRLRRADIWLFATPVYWDGVTGPMKDLMDRITPLSGPFYQIRNGHCTVQLRQGSKSGKVVLVSTCGLWEMDNFDPMLAHMRAFTRTSSKVFAGAVLRPHADEMKPMIERGVSLDDLFQAAERAGRQLIRDGKMSTRTLKTISRELMSRDEYIKLANEGVQRELDKLKKF